MEQERNRWDGDVPAVYDRSFAHMCAGASDAILLHATPGRLIDAGCGTGRFAACAQAAGWQVRGFDGDQAMVTLAKARGIDAICDRLPHLHAAANWRAETVVANFVIQHLSEPLAAIKALAALTTPATSEAAGRLIITSWPPMWLAHRALWMEAFAALDAAPVAMAAPACDTSPAGLGELVGAAGLRVAVAKLVQWDWQIDWQTYLAGVQAGIAYIGKRYLAQQPAVQREIVTYVQRAMERFGAPGMMTLPCTASMVVGEAA